MPRKRRPSAALAAPTSLTTFDPDDADLIVVVIETPKGSRNKYAYDPDERVFSLTKVLPAGMAFPYDFGFVPSTLAEDGDPLDVLVLMDEPAFTGCRIACRLVGVIEGEQVDRRDTTRNDRIVGVEQGNHSFTHIRRMDDLGKHFEKELEEFFVNFHRLEGKGYRVLGVKGPAEARRRVKACRKAARRHSGG
jgi:inorganic pyrophosphatase